MKKQVFLILSLVTILVIACTNHEEIALTPQQSEANNSSIRSFEEAFQIAQSAIPIIEGSTVTRGGCHRKIDLNGSKVYKLDATRGSSTATNDTLMYIFNFENNEGFAIVAAPKNTEGLLAITERGHFEPGTKTGIEGFDMFVDMAEEYVNRMALLPIDSLALVLLRTRYTSHTPQAGPYIEVKWGQRYPEGEFCPNGVSGCTNTAMAQIMTYFQYPSSINLTYDERDMDTQYLNWTNMISHTTGHSLLECPSYQQDTHSMIGRLCRQLGEMNNSTYVYESGTTPASTGTNTLAYAASTFATLGYTTNPWDSIPHIDLESELDDGHILLVRGSRSGSGHAWVLDGYTEAEYYEEIYHISGNTIIIDETFGPLYTNLYHINWGWYGMNNGYFAHNVFNTKKVIFPEGNIIFTDRNYSIGVKFLPVYR